MKPAAKKKPAKSKPSAKPAAAPAPNRPPLRLEYIDPATLDDNPANWRRHPETQMAALDELLNEQDEGGVGWAGALLYNERTRRLIDGHGRKAAWTKSHPGKPVPVLVGSWSDEDEKKILLTLDPLAGLATPDVAMLSKLLDEIPLETALSGIAVDLADTCLAAVDELKLTAEKRVKAKRAAASSSDGADKPEPTSKYAIIIDCESEAAQVGMLERLSEDGIECRALIG